MTAVQAPPRRKAAKTARGRGPVPWWGDYGPPPHERWPGVTIAMPAVWSKKASRWESPDGRYYFDTESADKACDELSRALQDHVKTALAPYKYPRWIEFRAELPKTATGKIQRFKLRAELKGR